MKKSQIKRFGAPAAFLACLMLTICLLKSMPRTDRRRTILDFSLASLDRLGVKIAAGQDLTRRCGARSFGTGFGLHSLCTRPIQAPTCYFYSFGISTDYSFDIDVANSTGCIGFAADPTITHPSKLHPRVFFTQMAANSYDADDTAQFPLRTSVPALRMLLGHDHITVLKMDCEGCEYALARDILQHDPAFFHHVDQFAVEVHYSKIWLKGRAHLHGLAALMELLEDAGLELVHALIGSCSPIDQATGVVSELKDLKLFEAGGKDRHCHNYLFARV